MVKTRNKKEMQQKNKERVSFKKNLNIQRIGTEEE